MLALEVDLVKSSITGCLLLYPSTSALNDITALSQ